MRSVTLGTVLHGAHGPAVEAFTGPLRQYAAEWCPATDASTLASFLHSVRALTGTDSSGRWHGQVRGPLLAMLRVVTL